MKVLFLDESGDQNLNPVRTNLVYRVFVSGSEIVERACTRNVIDPEPRAFKLRHFGREDVVLQTVEMAKGRGRYGFLANPVHQANSYCADRPK